MGKHKDAGTRCLVMHYEGEGQCIGCICGKYHSPSEFKKLTASQLKEVSNGGEDE